VEGPDNIILFDKPYKWTSFDVVNYVKKATGYKVGHAGTLDPLATGLLILCTGKRTKDISTFQEMEKEYTGTIHLGATTPCFDLEKEPDAFFPTEHITTQMLHDTAIKTTGEQDQVPPLFSAKKVDGKRAYEMAREGSTHELKSNRINIKQFELTRIEMPEVDFRIVCSKGTYIRSIARDFGVELNSGAYLQALRRTRIGNYRVEDAFTLERFRELFPLAPRKQQ
jgi:tRNA pseudouridine55 synthase